MSAQLQAGKQKPKFTPYRGPRDVMTGAPIRRDGSTIVRRIAPDDRVDVQPTRAERAAGWRHEPDDFTARPLRLHQHESETTTFSDGAAADDGHGALGGPRFSRDFARYLAKVKPRLVVGWQLRLRYWWVSAYGRARVERAFLRELGAERGAVAYRAALALASGYLEYDAVMAQTGYSANRLSKFVSLARRFAGQPAQAA